jgi:hypothetical protein
LPSYLSAADEFQRRAPITLGSDAVREGDPTPTLASLSWSWAAVRDTLVMKGLLVPTGLGVVALVLDRRTSAPYARTLLLAWTVPAVVGLLIIPNKDGRYLVPLLPAVALMAAAGLQTLPWPTLRRGLWALVVAAGTFQFAALSFGWPVPAEYGYARPPARPDWKIDAILTEIATLPRDRPLHYVAILPNEADFEPNIFMLAAAVRRLPMQVEVVGYADEPVRAWARYDVIVSKTGSIAVTYAVESRRALRAALETWAADPAARPALARWRTWPLPDGSTAEAYVVLR